MPLVKASGLARSRATNIWSSDTFDALVASAILLALSPAFTVTCWPPGVGAAAALAGAAATGTLAVALPTGLSGAAGGRAAATRAGASGAVGADEVTGTGAEAAGKS